MKRMMAQAMLTGAFCIPFALVVGVVTDALSLGGIVAASFASGFLGSLVAQLFLDGGAGQGAAPVKPER